MARRELSQRRLERREDAIWSRNLHLQDKNLSAQYRDIDAADDIRQRTREKVSEILEKAQNDAASSSAKIRASYATREKELLSATRTALTGATRGKSTPLMVWHWKAVMPAELRERFEIERTDAGPILGLPPGGGMESSHSIPDILVTEQPELLSDSTFMEWAKTVAAIWHDEVSERYQILARLRDDDWFAEFAEAVGIHDPRKGEEPLRGRYGEYKRPVVLNVIPSISRVEVDEDGLVLTFAHNAKASAKAWSAKLDLIRNGWKAAGMDASHLRLTDAADGGVQMRFDDAPSAFPLAIAPPPITPPLTVSEAKRRYPELTWSLGVDARGNSVEPSVKNVYHALVVGETGSGKSVYLSGLIEAWRPFARVFLADPKGSDYTALENAPGVVMRSEDPAQHVVLVGEVLRELQRRQRSAGVAKRDGDTNSAFDFVPVLLVLDEFTALLQDVRRKFGSKGVEAFLDAVDSLMRKGRAFAIHIVIGSQDLYKDSIPVEIQGNAQLLVAAGQVTDRTLMSKFIPDALSDDAKRIGQRINSKQKGRALYVDTENGKVREVQTYYAWSPGTTSLDPAAPAKVRPPTDEVRAAWEAADRVCRSMPRLYPRLGIKVDDPEWTEADVAELLLVPTIALDGADGRPLPDRVQYDHRNALDWIGAEQIMGVTTEPETLEEMAEAGIDRASNSRPGHPVTPKGNHGGGQSVEFDADAVPTDAVPAGADAVPIAPLPTATAPALDLDSLTAAERAALLARLLSARVTAEDVSTEAPAPAKAEEPAPAISPEKSIRTSAAQKGFSL